MKNLGRPTSVFGLNSWKSSQFPSSTPQLWSHFGGQRRTMFVQTLATPNPLSMMFYPRKLVTEAGSADFLNARAAMNSPLAKALFGIDAIMDFFTSGKHLIVNSNTMASMRTAIHEDDSETVALIKKLLETHIRPAVQDDGGDIE